MTLFAVASVASGRELVDRFCAANPGYPIDRAFVRDPGSLNRGTMVASGLLTADNKYLPWAMAQASVHVAIWRTCVAENVVAHVADDRAVIRADFTDVIAEHTADPSSFDVIVWGFDFTDPAEVRFAPGVEGRLLHDQSRLTPDFDVFRASRARTRRFRLLYCATACGYTISPAGARTLLERCLPMGSGTLPYFGDSKVRLPNTGFDREMARQYPLIQAYVVQPLIAILPHGGAPQMITQHFLYSYYNLAKQAEVQTDTRSGERT